MRRYLGIFAEGPLRGSNTPLMLRSAAARSRSARSGMNLPFPRQVWEGGARAKRIFGCKALKGRGRFVLGGRDWVLRQAAKPPPRRRERGRTGCTPIL